MKKLSAYTYHPTTLPKAKPSDRTSFFPKTSIRLSLLFGFLWACVRHWVNPWHYFGLNSRYFNRKKNIFSKLDMDRLIPESLRLRQYYYDPERLPETFPVFIKPEWGQNSKGIVRIHSTSAYRAFQDSVQSSEIPFIVQESARKKKEYEIYYLRSPQNLNACRFLSVTEVKNPCTPFNPINSIYNPATTYIDITPTLSDSQKQKIWASVKHIGRFRLARVCAKADSLSDLLNQNFKIVEINIFLPMPLALMADNVPMDDKQQIIRQTMSIAARLAKGLPKNESGRDIFFRKILPVPVFQTREERP